MRINILYLIDNLCEASLTHQVQAPKPLQPSTSTSSVPNAPGSYAQYVAQDLEKIVKLVVPEARGGLVNLMSTQQASLSFLQPPSSADEFGAMKILDSWRTKRIMDPALIDELLLSLGSREERLQLTTTSSSQSHRDANDFPKDEVLRRFEEDRERVSYCIYICPYII